jgi:hypothetical protein
MHDDSVLVERRIRRELLEKVLPAMYSATMPMTVQAWDAPGEPVPYGEAMAALATQARPFAIGAKWSRPWGTTWFRFTADVPAAWSGPQLEAVIDLGFHPDAAGFQAEGLVWSPGADGLGAPCRASTRAAPGSLFRWRPQAPWRSCSRPPPTRPSRWWALAMAISAR